MKESYFDIYEAANQAEAAARYDAWAKRVGPEHRAAFAPALYSKGAHRIETKRRSFARQDWSLETFYHAAPTEFAYTGMVGRAGMMRAPPAQPQEVEEVNYGVDIARLVAMLDTGEI